jgi:hypothetical protein
MSDLKFSHDALLGAYEKRLLERVDSETKALANGHAADFVDYKTRAERIKTLHLALDDLSAAVKTYLDEDEDDD